MTKMLRLTTIPPNQCRILFRPVCPYCLVHLYASLHSFIFKTIAKSRMFKQLLFIGFTDLEKSNSTGIKHCWTVGLIFVIIVSKSPNEVWIHLKRQKFRK